MAKDYIIGLDLGINNVGYSVIDMETNKIIESGVRLYNEASKAEDRRISRNTRRRMKRKDNRVHETLALFQKIGFPNQNTVDEELLQKRIKGLKEKLEKQEIVNIVCYFMSHRGYIPFGNEERELVNLKGKTPSEYYLKLYQDLNKFRALEKVVNHEDLKKELITILTNQSIYYKELKEIIGDDKTGLLWIFDRKRKFWEGPGSEISFTPYGRFQSKEDVLEYENLKKEKKEKFLFENLIGHCKIYLDEKCAPKANFYAEKFNLINDFINIRVINIEHIKTEEYVKLSKYEKDTYKLTTKAIEDILKYCMNYEGTLTYTKVLKETLGLTKKDINGYRIKKDGTPDFSLMKTYRYVINKLQEENLDVTWLLENDYQNYNELMNILAVSPGIVETVNMMSSIHSFNEKEIEIFQNISNKLKKDQVLSYHSLSEKALKRAIQDMLSTELNFMQVSQKFDYEKESREYRIQNYGNKEGLLHMNPVFVDDIIASPQVKKTLRQAIRIINAIIKENKSLPKIISIESTKEMNGEEKRKEIERDQKRNETNRKASQELLESVTSDDKITENMILRVQLFQELDGKCPYCGKPISINDVLNNTVEVEHILPISQSADDSEDNKTLSCRECNEKKKNKTPYQFLTEQEFENFAKQIKKLKISEQKMKNFLTEEDMNKYKIRFFHRNLQDTSYATKELVNQVHIFNDYLKATVNNLEVKTLSTPGQLTHKIRKHWNIEKDRDEGKFHHAVDASIVAGIATTKVGKMIIESQNNSQFWILNRDAEKTMPHLLEKFDMPEIKKEIEKIKSDDDIKISMQVNKDLNRSIANANISSYIKKDDSFYIIEQIDDIYSPDLIRKDKDKEKIDVLFDENNPKFILLCQEQDSKLFYYLKEIYQKYQNNKTNPFLNYCEEVNLTENEKFQYLKHGIHAPSKNNQGAIVKRLRYMRKVTDPFLINKSSIKTKENTYIGYDSVSIYCTRLFWDKDLKKIIFIPVYVPAVDFKTKKINENHPLYQNYYERYIKGKNTMFIVDLFNGNYIEITKGNGEIRKEYVKGYSKNSKSIQCKSGGYLSPKDKFSLYDVDILGNKKLRLTWPKD